jgi:membrane associated rhomboid family serine protease
LIPLRDSVRRSDAPLITLALLAAKLVGYLLAVRHGGSIVDGPTSATLIAYGAIPYEFAHPASHCALGAAGFSQIVLCTGQRDVVGTLAPQPPTWETAFTSIFIETNLLALLITTAFLAVVGATLENTLGRLRFLAYFLLGALAALALTVAANPATTTPSLTAAGAVAALLAGYVLLHPKASVLTFIVPLFRSRTLAARALLALWLALELALGAAHVTAPSGTPFDVVLDGQLGGLAFGLLAAYAFARRGRHEPVDDGRAP